MKQNSRTPYVKLVALVVAGIASIGVHAQALPPACQQITTAFQVCSASLIRLMELREPASVPKAKQQFESATNELNSTLRLGIQKRGAQKVAEYCASPEFKGKMVEQITGIITILGFNRSIDNDCLKAYSAIR